MVELRAIDACVNHPSETENDLMAIVEPLDCPPGSRRRLRLRSPATLEPIGEIEVQTSDDVREALERARKVQPVWAALSIEERAHYLESALRLVIQRQDEIIEVVLRETAKARGEALSMEVFASCDALSYYARRAPRMHGITDEINRRVDAAEDDWDEYAPVLRAAINMCSAVGINLEIGDHEPDGTG